MCYSNTKLFHLTSSFLKAVVTDRGFFFANRQVGC